MAGTPNAINATLYDKLPFNFASDIAPVAAILSAPDVMTHLESQPSSGTYMRRYATVW
jgi:hypothetical protein